MANGAKQGVRREIEDLSKQMTDLIKQLKKQAKDLVVEQKKMGLVEATSKPAKKRAAAKKTGGK